MTATQKYTSLICLGISAMIIIDSFGVIEALLMFLITGTLPMTGFVVPPVSMMAFFGGVFLIVVTYGYQRLLDKLDLTGTRHRLPARRFRNI